MGGGSGYGGSLGGEEKRTEDLIEDHLVVEGSGMEEGHLREGRDWRKVT